MDKAIEFLKNNISKNETVVCACSGGPDSMVLLSLLNDLTDELNLKLICAHVNHSLREESKEEYEFVQNYCGKHNITFEGTILTNYDGNIESSARKQRYAFFESIIKKYNAKYLLTAHHGDDLIETILMKIARGSSLDGYIGFDYKIKKEDYYLLRPLVFYTKKEINEYATNNKIEFRIDNTNFDKKYTRNRYRMNILPLLKQEDDNIHLKYLSFSNEVKDASNFINNYVDSKYNEIVVNNRINIDLLNSEDEYIIRKIIYKYLKEIYKEKINYIESKHINYIIELLQTNKPNISIDLPLDITISKNYNFISLKEIDINNYKYEINNLVKVPYGVIKKVDQSDLTNNFVCYLNSKDIKLPIYVRNREDGDTIKLLGLNKNKKVKDIFINEKIDLNIRDNYPIVVDSDNNILWIPGVKKSVYDNIKTGKYDIILEYDKEE